MEFYYVYCIKLIITLAKLISEVRKKLNTHLNTLTKFLEQTVVLKSKIFFDIINVNNRKLKIKNKLTFYKYTHKISKKYLISKKTKLFNLMRYFLIKTFTQLKLVINFVLGSVFLFLF